MPDQVYQVGEPVPLQATFTNAAGTPTNTTVALKIRKPSGTVLTPSPTNTSAGVYVYNQLVDEAGLWWYTFTGTGAVAAVEQNSFVVQAVQTDATSLSATALVTLEDAREYVFNNIRDDTNDFRLMRKINTWSDVVIGYTKREWRPLSTAVTRRFVYSGYGMLPLSPYDLRAVSAITAFTDYPTTYQMVLVAGTTSVLGEYRLRAGVGRSTGTYRWIDFTAGSYTNVPAVQAYSYGDYDRRLEVSVTGDWGISVIPERVKEAVLIAIRNSYENPEGAASRTAGAFTLTPQSDLVEDDPGEPWRALPFESRALLAEFREQTVLVA